MQKSSSFKALAKTDVSAWHNMLNQLQLSDSVMGSVHGLCLPT